MLVLGRKEGEKIVVGEGLVTIVIVECRSNGTVRVGIDAPREMRVDREEVHLERMAQGGAA